MRVLHFADAPKLGSQLDGPPNSWTGLLFNSTDASGLSWELNRRPKCWPAPVFHSLDAPRFGWEPDGSVYLVGALRLGWEPYGLSKSCFRRVFHSASHTRLRTWRASKVLTCSGVPLCRRSQLGTWRASEMFTWAGVHSADALKIGWKLDGLYCVLHSAYASRLYWESDGPPKSLPTYVFHYTPDSVGNF